MRKNIAQFFIEQTNFAKPAVTKIGPYADKKSEIRL